MNHKYQINLTMLMIDLSIIILLLISYHFFYLFPYPDILVSAFSSINRCIITIFLAVLTIMMSSYQFYISSWLKNYMLGMVAVAMCLVLFSTLEYPAQSLWTDIQLGLRFITPIFSVLFFYYFSHKGVDSLFRLINIMATIYCIIILLQALIYQMSGAYILSFDSIKLATRNEGLRLGIGDFTTVALIYNFYSIYIKNKKNISYMIPFILMLIALFFCDQTRVTEAIVVVSILFLILKKRTNLFLKLIIFFIVTILLIGFSQTEIFSNYIESFSSGSDSYSTMARAYAVRYYLEQFFTNPLFGTGLVDPYEYSPYAYIAHGSMMMAYFDDVGLIGLLGSIGLFAIPVFFVPLYHFISITKKIRRKLSNENFIFLEVLLLYLLMTSATLLVTDPQRMIVFSFYIGIFEYSYYLSNKSDDTLHI